MNRKSPPYYTHSWRIESNERTHRAVDLLEQQLLIKFYSDVSYNRGSNIAPSTIITDLTAGTEDDRNSNSSSNSNNNNNNGGSEESSDENLAKFGSSNVDADYKSAFDEQSEIKRDGHRSSNSNGNDTTGDGQSGPLDPWSIVWYIGSFGGLVAFFLIVSCSEWCCRQGARPLTVPCTQRGEIINMPHDAVAVDLSQPPPPYHLFAPPSYTTLGYPDISKDKLAAQSQAGSGVGGQSEKLDIYVITLPPEQPPQPPQQASPA
ncbi:hypothetical protein TKK_0013269 [Trichogramma kaykai]|uniref:Uncharacterized protein n=1 Tax=Trichogramma kaykai TaxID=54128 RepID=A0ABD2WJ14_9HYME